MEKTKIIIIGNPEIGSRIKELMAIENIDVDLTVFKRNENQNDTKYLNISDLYKYQGSGLIGRKATMAEIMIDDNIPMIKSNDINDLLKPEIGMLKDRKLDEMVSPMTSGIRDFSHAIKSLNLTMKEFKPTYDEPKSKYHK